MKCLSEEEVTDWLERNKVTPKPYERADRPLYSLQFRQPVRATANGLFLGQYLQIIDCEILIHFTDWPTYTPPEMLVVDALRQMNKEARALIDAPGHLLAGQESDLAIALLGHCSNCEWDSYAYAANDKASLNSWEGELYDFFTNDLGTLEAVSQIVKQFGLEND